MRKLELAQRFRDAHRDSVVQAAALANITTEYNIDVVPTASKYFEFKLRNPYDRVVSLCVVSSSKQLKLVNN